MNQLALFRPPDLLLTELHVELAHLRFQPARDCLAEYQRNWGDAGLTWESAFLDFWVANEPPQDPDAGWGLWLELRATDFWPRIPLSVQLGFRTSYFALVVSLLPDDPQVRTPRGISKGYLHYLAGQPESALAFLQREVNERGEDPVASLHLGNTLYLLNDKRAARDSYRDALLKGLKPDGYPEILDSNLRACLADADAPEWAVIEACFKGLLPVSRLRSAKSAQAFWETRVWLKSPGAATSASPIRQFYDCLVLSENRAVVPEDALMKARLHMKFLNGRLHRQHMDALEVKERPDLKQLSVP